MKGFSLKCIVLKVDVTGLENKLFVGASVHLSARNFKNSGSEGVNGETHSVAVPESPEGRVQSIALVVL